MVRSLLLFFTIILFSINVFATGQQTIEVEVTGMTCPFCVYGTEKKLGKLEGVEKVEVSLAKKKARIVMKEGREADISAIKSAITDAGFTAGKTSINGVSINENVVGE